MTEEIKKDKFWIMGVMNGTLVIVEDENGEPRKYSEKDIYKAAEEKAKEAGLGYSVVVFEAIHAEQPKLITHRISFMRSSKIEVELNEIKS